MTPPSCSTYPVCHSHYQKDKPKCIGCRRDDPRDYMDCLEAVISRLTDSKSSVTTNNKQKTVGYVKRQHTTEVCPECNESTVHDPVPDYPHVKCRKCGYIHWDPRNRPYKPSKTTNNTGKNVVYSTMMQRADANYLQHLKKWVQSIDYLRLDAQGEKNTSVVDALNCVEKWVNGILTEEEPNEDGD